MNTTPWIVSEIQKIADFFKMAPPNGHWPKVNFSNLKNLKLGEYNISISLKSFLCETTVMNRYLQGFDVFPESFVNF